jgi:uncharacterized DUF497 family protein
VEQFEWDEDKNVANRHKHGIGFDLVYAFDWPRAVYRTDDREDYGEVRRLAYGFASNRAFAIVFVVRGGRVRIISVRPMHAKEMKKHGLKTPS